MYDAKLSNAYSDPEQRGKVKVSGNEYKKPESWLAELDELAESERINKPPDLGHRMLKEVRQQDQRREKSLWGRLKKFLGFR
jgi:hypothetical protein